MPLTEYRKEIEFAAKAHGIDPDVLEACSALAHDVENVLLGAGLPRWEGLSVYQQRDRRRSTEAALQGATPVRAHAAFVQQMTDLGWTHGTEKNHAAKTAPYLCAYEDLPEDVRARREAVYGAIMECAFPTPPPPPEPEPIPESASSTWPDPEAFATPDESTEAAPPEGGAAPSSIAETAPPPAEDADDAPEGEEGAEESEPDATHAVEGSPAPARAKRSRKRR